MGRFEARAALIAGLQSAPAKDLQVPIGRATPEKAIAAAAAMGRRALLATGVSRERAAPLAALLEAAGVACVSFTWTTPGRTTFTAGGARRATLIVATVVTAAA